MKTVPANPWVEKEKNPQPETEAVRKITRFDPVISARKVLKTEAEAILKLIEHLDDSFRNAVNLILACEGKVVVTGLGKSGIIAHKFASTLSSTGTPAVFLHPTESIHGGLGILSGRDMLVALSNSGETEEMLELLPIIKRLGLKLIAITGNSNSTLSQSADIILDASVPNEACPFGISPTASTTAALALSDALAIALMERRGISQEDLALIHPGGIIGRRLLLRVEDLMHTGSEIPLAAAGLKMRDILLVITGKRLGVAGVTNTRGELIGVITDGDLRRALERYPDLLERHAEEIMNRDPKKIERQALAAQALHIMEQYSITSLFVYEQERMNTPVGIIHLHDLIRAGIL
ncbi:MAG: KpsF/GutQ family sugar-phosphate isomerase [Proteobacteria bacterium]|nr:KpsF/GutQ family sugar-phosphate isomerase [Pseudomonadota bacterium]